MVESAVHSPYSLSVGQGLMGIFVIMVTFGYYVIKVWYNRDKLKLVLDATHFVTNQLYIQISIAHYQQFMDIGNVKMFDKCIGLFLSLTLVLQWYVYLGSNDIVSLL